MIYYNSNIIKDWNFGDDNIIKVYRNNAVCYYKITGGGDTPTAQTPCFAVVDDITQYQETEFEDVFNKADNKWYKLNNLNQYEKYGVYGSGRTITTYEGKLTVDEETPSRLPQGYTEVEYVENTASGSNTSSTSRLAVKFEDSITNNESGYTYEITGELNVGNTSAYWDFCGNPYVQLQRTDSGYGNMFEPRAWGKHFNTNIAGTFFSDIKYKIRIFQGVSDAYPILEITNITAETTNSYSMTATRSNMQNNSVKFGLFSFYNVSDSGARTVPAKIYELKIYDRENNLLAHAVPCKRDIDGKVGFYNLARDEFEYDASGELTLIAGEPIAPTKTYEYIYSGGSWANVGEVSGSTVSYKYWMWRSTGDIVGNPSNFIQFSEFDLSVDGSDVSLTYISASPTGVTNETADNLFDNSTNTKYCADFSSYKTTNYVLFESQSAITPTSFAMTTANDSASTSRYPKNWVLLGSHTSTTNWDDGSWDVVLSGTCGNEMKANYKRVNYPIEVESGSTYPIYYTEMQDPPNNLSFSSMAEAEAYECPWVGMNATIDGDKYVFSGDSQSGYEWVYNPIDYSTHYLSMVAQTNGVSFKYDTATSSNSLQYSLDSGSTWNSLSNGQSTSSINNGEKIMFKASSLTVNTERGVGRITPSSSATVEGNIMSLAYGDNFSGQTVIPNNYQFRKLFSGVTTITSAENMVLPATTVKQQCYSQMFQGCTTLTTTPKVIGSSAMTWSGQYCFSDMFHGCTNLTTAPSDLLPSTNLGSCCYWCMFNDCTSLTKAPTLPATTLVSNCYQEMFKGCTNLNYIEALFTTTPSSSYMSNWVYGVASSGTFVKNSSATWSTSCGTSTYPCNWTVQNG